MFRHRKVIVPSVEGFHFYNSRDIIRFESEGNYCKIFLINNLIIHTTRSLKEYELRLEGNGFFRPHTSHLINLEYVQKYVKGRGGYLVMDDGVAIDVSVRRRVAFLEIIEENI